jgi:hypothetical protein
MDTSSHAGLPGRARRLARAAIVFGTVSLLATSARAQLVAVPLPDPKVLGFHFPESEAQIIQWVDEMSRSPDPKKAKAAFDSVHLHGWGIWTALTTETNQVINGQKVRVFETWYTPDDLPSAGGQMSRLKAIQRGRSTPKPFHRFERVHPARSKFLAAGPTIGRVAGFVKYDPGAAEHIVTQGSLHSSTAKNGARIVVDKQSLWQRKALNGSRLRLLIWGVLAAFLVVDTLRDPKRIGRTCSDGIQSIIVGWSHDDACTDRAHDRHRGAGRLDGNGRLGGQDHPGAERRPEPASFATSRHEA